MLLFVKVGHFDMRKPKRSEEVILVERLTLVYIVLYLMIVTRKNSTTKKIIVL